MVCLDLCIFQCIFFILLSVMMMASAQWTWVLASSRSYWGTGNRMLLHPGSQSFRHSLETELQFSCSVVSYSLWPHGLQHTRLPCPSPSPGTCWNTSPSSQWWHPTISSSVVPFYSCLLSFPASGSFPMSQLFISGGQSIGVSASTSVLPMNIQGWFPLGLNGLILQSRDSQESSPTPQFKSINSSVLSFLYKSEVSQKEKHQYSILTHIYGI